MKRFLMMLSAAGVAALLAGCSADSTPPSVATSGDTPDARQTTPESSAEVRLISLSVPNMT